MFAKKALGVLVLSGAMGLSGCVNTDGTNNNTGTGAGIGAVVGGLLGRVISTDNETGTAIGAVVGGVVGGVIGSQLDAQEEALRGTMGSSVGIVNTGSQLIVSLPEDITFDINSSVVKSSLVGDLNTLAASMNEFPNSTIRVVGHTDNTGTSNYNQALSESRARAVRGILVDAGVNGGRVLAYGEGEASPVASNATPEGRQQNRRVEVFITPTE